MMISPRSWFLIANSESDSSKFKVQIQNKRCERKVRADLIKICVCKDADLVYALIPGQIDWELEDFLSASRNHSLWEETNGFEITDLEDGQDCLLLKIPRDNSPRGDRLFKLGLEDDEHHIIYIDGIHDDSFRFNLANRQVELNTKLIRNFLFKGLSNVEMCGTPGQIHCFGKRSIGLLGGGNTSKGSFGWCSGISLYGDGAILSFSHESFILGEGGQRALGVILENLFRFKQELRKERRVGFVGFSDSESSGFICNVSSGGFMCSRNSFFESVELNSIGKCVNTHELDILVINGNKEEKNQIHETRLSSKVLERFISSGKLLIIGLCPWGWEYITGGRLDSHSISNNINKEMGMVFTDEYFHNEGSYIGTQDPKGHLLSTFHYWRKLIHSVESLDDGVHLHTEEYLLMTKDIECHLKRGVKTNEQKKILNLIAQLLKKKVYLKLRPPFSMQQGLNILLMAIAHSRMLEDQLAEICSSKDESCTFDDFDAWINMNLFWKMETPVSDLDSSELNVEEFNLSTHEAFCPIYDTPHEWQNTGVYIKYKNALRVEFVPGNQCCSPSFRLKIHIGSHGDFLRYKESEILERVPLISKTYNWHLQESSHITIESPCEGIVYFEYIPEIESSNAPEPNTLPDRSNPCNCLMGMLKFVPLIEEEVTLTPIFTIDKAQANSCPRDNRVVVTSIDFWARFFSRENIKFSSLLPAWVELLGRKIALTIPIRVLYRMNCFIIDGLLEFWDSVVDTQNELYPNCKWTRERIVCDIQISDGYMHSDIVEEQLESGGLLDLETLKTHGNWGLYHELGHNRQSEYWTFSGTEEVTVNLFTMYTYYKLHSNLYPFKMEYVKDQISLGIEYLLETNSMKDIPGSLEQIFKEKWMTNHGIAFCNYLILLTTFGWDAFKAVFQLYDRLSEIDKELMQTHDSQQKMSVWIIIFSSVVGVNLKDFFYQWGWWFCMERAKSEIDIKTLCVRMQNHLVNIKNAFAKNRISEGDIVLGYEDLAQINGWRDWSLDSLELLLDFQTGR